MISSALVVSLVLSQYVRTRVDDPPTPTSQCLWWRENKNLIFHQNVDGNPDTPGETEFTAVARAIDSWNTVAQGCSSLALADGPRTSSRTIGHSTEETDESVVLFRLRSCSEVVPPSDQCHTDDNCGNKYDCWQHGQTAIAITTTSFNYDSGRILDADIELNAVNFLFTAVDSPPCPPRMYSTSCVATDVQNTMTHELGHALGLAHTNATGSIMVTRADPGETSKRIIDLGSAKFVCDVYAAGSVSKTCITKPFDGTLGKKAGCSAVPPSAWVAGLALLGLRRRR